MTTPVLTAEQQERVEAAKLARGILGRGAQVTNAAEIAALASFIIDGGDADEGWSAERVYTPGGWTGVLSTYATTDEEHETAEDEDPRHWWRRLLDGWPLAETLAALIVALVWVSYLIDGISFQTALLLLVGIAATNVAGCRSWLGRRW